MAIIKKLHTQQAKEKVGTSVPTIKKFWSWALFSKIMLTVSVSKTRWTSNGKKFKTIRLQSLRSPNGLLSLAFYFQKIAIGITYVK